MILKIFFAILFTNIFGILYDIIDGDQSVIRRRNYLNSGILTFAMLFFRTLIFFIRGFTTFKRKYSLDSILLVFFVLSIYFLLDYQIEVLEPSFYFLAVMSFLLWAVIYSYLAASSSFLYEDKEFLELSSREMRVHSNSASFSDRGVLFIKNIFASVFSPPTYILSIITALYIYFVGKLL